MASQNVNVDNFVRAETARMFTALQHQGGGVNRLHHIREPAPLDDQPVIRQNRDTLYSSAIVDLTGGATLALPDAGERYLSVMVVARTTTSTGSCMTPGSTSSPSRTTTPTMFSSPRGSSSTRTTPATWRRSTSSRTGSA